MLLVLHGMKESFTAQKDIRFPTGYGAYAGRSMICMGI
jgi:hypothetical protein